MGKHNKLVSKLKKRIDATLRHKQEIEQAQNEELTDQVDQYLALKSDNFEDRRFVMNALIHACDIGNPCLKFESYMNWSYLVTQEFND